MTAKENGSAWSDTWRTEAHPPPVAFVDKGSGPNGEDVTRYYTYTVKELNMTYASGDTDGNAETKTPAEAGYSVSVKYGTDKDGKYVATVTNFSPLPETGGNGTLLFVSSACSCSPSAPHGTCAPTAWNRRRPGERAREPRCRSGRKRGRHTR